MADDVTEGLVEHSIGHAAVVVDPESLEDGTTELTARVIGKCLVERLDVVEQREARLQDGCTDRDLGDADLWSWLDDSIWRLIWSFSGFIAASSFISWVRRTRIESTFTNRELPVIEGKVPFLQ